MVHGTGDYMTTAIRSNEFKCTATHEHDVCEHTNTNASDPIRNP